MNLIAQKLGIKGKSQGWLVDRIKKLFPTSKITRQSLNAIIKNRYNPTLLNAYKISKAMGCLIEELWSFDEE